MSHTGQNRGQRRRAALGDATRRVNNGSSHSYNPTPDKLPQEEGVRTSAQLPAPDLDLSHPASPKDVGYTHHTQVLDPSPGSNVPNPRLSAISKECHADNSNRNSQISTTSTNASDGRRRKTHIGPWHLGKTLGKGATARVRMARHAVTGQPSAIKIVQKKNAQLSQAGSLASLDKKDVAFPDSGDGFRRMPYGIEREVAIMKLIEHPHIMKLYDIWENRTEIYLVLEFVDNGELFEHISRSGRLPEEEALKYFRQLLSAVGYCHHFKICHRDLKPENILLTKHGDIKIADFGMAALQQTPEHKLQTSCGSPHYAAPEVIKAIPYQGDKVDIWSMGVILFAELSGRLPFDNPTLPGLLAAIQKGHYKIPSCIGPEASDLIQRMLKVDARERISIRQIWRHPLLKKYDYLDEFGGGANPRSPDVRSCGRPVLRRSDIDRELLRHLRSMWHQFEEHKIVNLLLNDQPNDQKLFYSLLLKHRECQLENYAPDVSYSNSDYHHTRPLAQIKKLSTRNFVQPSSKGHGRQVSRFTVVSNVSKDRHMRQKSEYAETDVAETVQSYDPFKASRPQYVVQTLVSAKPKVIVHRQHHSKLDEADSQIHAASRLLDGKAMTRAMRSSADSNSRQLILAPPRVFASRSSLASSTRSRGSASMIRVSNGYRRGVSFSHLRKSSALVLKKSLESRGVERHSKNSEVTDDGGDVLRAVTSPPVSMRYVRSANAPNSALKSSLCDQKQDRISGIWHEDVRQLSSSLAKDCDEAFNRTSVASTVRTNPSGQHSGRNSTYETPVSSNTRNSVPAQSPTGLTRLLDRTRGQTEPDRSSWDSRPLPTPPTRSESIAMELADARRQAQLRKHSGRVDESPGHLNRMVSHIDNLMQSNPPPTVYKNSRRVVSAPVNSKSQNATRLLPLIYEFSGEDVSSKFTKDYQNFIRQEQAKDSGSVRITSAPQPRVTNLPQDFDVEDKLARKDPHAIASIRMVNPTSPSPAKVPPPLNIRKKNSQGPQTIMTGGLDLPLICQTQGHTPLLDLRTQYANTAGASAFPNLGVIAEASYPDGSLNGQNVAGTSRKKSSNWFKMTSRSGVTHKMQAAEKDGVVTASSSSNGVEIRIETLEPITTDKKKGFALGRLFKKRAQKDGDMSIGAFEIYDDDATGIVSIPEDQCYQHFRPVTNLETRNARQIEPQQNWLARLFHVKPASRLMCFSVSKRRARQEVTTLLKQWRKYGTKDIVVDKERNIIFGSVGARNYLQMKEVSFASEFMTVIEHGKRSPLCIARFTQEKGAASSFFKVVETLETVLKSRGMIVSDKRRRRMMIKTHNSSS